MNKQIEVKPVTKTEFSTWLKSLSQDKKFAKAGAKRFCPLAKFYRQKFGYTGIQVGVTHVVVQGKKDTRYWRDTTPLEVSFIMALDGCFESGEGVTPKNALTILKYCKSK